MDNASFEYRLKKLRIEKEMTIADLSAKIGISASAISNYERGVRMPDGDTLIKLSNYFNCTTDYLLGLSQDKNYIERERYSGFIGEFNEYYMGLNREDRSRFVNIFDCIKGIETMCRRHNFDDLRYSFLTNSNSIICHYYDMFQYLLERILTNDLYHFETDENPFFHYSFAVGCHDEYRENKKKSDERHEDMWSDIYTKMQEVLPVNIEEISKKLPEWLESRTKKEGEQRWHQ